MKNIILWVFIILFVLFAAVQYNDPDPYIWIPTYLLPAFLCYLKLRSSQGQSGTFLSVIPPIGYFAVAFLFFCWAANQFPPQWVGVDLKDFTMKAGDNGIELGRESMGLVICGVSMAICGLFK